MPLYEYRCRSCGRLHELEHGANDPRPTKCPACGGELVRVFHPVGVVFKGTGFHKTDYAGSKKSGAASASESKPAESAEPVKPKDSPSAETKKPDPKP